MENHTPFGPVLHASRESITHSKDVHNANSKQYWQFVKMFPSHMVRVCHALGHLEMAVEKERCYSWHWDESSVPAGHTLVSSARSWEASRDWDMPANTEKSHLLDYWHWPLCQGWENEIEIESTVLLEIVEKRTCSDWSRRMARCQGT